MTHTSTDLLVIGGGPAGIVAASAAARSEVGSVTLIEAQELLGGLHASRTDLALNGEEFDVGLVLFHDGHELLEEIPALKERLIPIAYRPRSITPEGKVSRYPLSLRDYRDAHGIFEVGASGMSLLVDKAKCRSRATCEDYARYYVGKRLLDRSGLGAYAERMNGLPLDQTDVAFAEYRLKMLRRFGLRKVAGRGLSRVSGRAASGIRVQRYVRKPGGFASFYDAARASLQESGVRLRLGERVDRIETEHPSAFTVVAGGTSTVAKHVVSTLPLEVTARLLGIDPAPGLEHRSLVSVHLVGAVGVDDAVIFNFSRSGGWKRMTNFRSFYGGGRDSVTVEYTIDEKPSDDDLERDVNTSLRRAGLACDLDLVGVTQIQRAYPLYPLGFRTARDALAGAIEAKGIETVGRQGRHAYQLSSEVARDAAELVRSMSFNT